MAAFTKEQRTWVDEFLGLRNGGYLSLRNDDDPGSGSGAGSGSSGGSTARPAPAGTTAQSPPTPSGGSGQTPPPSATPTKSLFDQLMDAIANDKVTEVKTLLPQIQANNINLDGKRNGDTPLTLAAKSKADDEEISKELVFFKAKLDVKNDGGKTPLYCSVETFRDHGGKRLFDYFLSKASPAIVDMPDKDGKTPLYVACGFDLYIVQELVGAGADLTVKVKGETLLMHASEESQEDIMNFLLTNGANVDAPATDGKTALMKLAGNKSNKAKVIGNAKALTVLLNNHAKINELDTQDQTALMLAAKAENSDIVIELAKQKTIEVNQKDNKEHNTALILAAHTLSAPAVKAILGTGRVADINVQNDNLRTALMEASDDPDGAFDAAKAVFDFGLSAQPKIDFDLEDNKGNTALMLAAGHGNGRLVELLAPKTTAKKAEALKLAQAARAKAVKAGKTGMALRPFDRAVTALGGTP